MREVSKNLRANRYRSRCSHQIPDGVERMDADIDERAAARALLFREPAADSGRDSARPDPNGFRKINLTETIRCDQFLRRAHRRRKAELPAEEINEAALFGFFLKHLHFGAVRCGRFFAEDVLACFQSRERCGEMEEVGQTNNHRIDFRIMKEVLVTQECFSG